MLDETTRLPEVVEPGLDSGQGVQRMLCSKSQNILIGGETMVKLRPNGRAHQRVHHVVISSSKVVSLVAPACMDTYIILDKRESGTVSAKNLNT